MKKIFSMFLILIMILPLLPVNASQETCLIEFSGTTPNYSMSGTKAFISGHHNDSAITVSHDGTTGWVLNPTADKTDTGYGYNTIHINLPNGFMNDLSGTKDVLMDVRYYDGESADKGSEFCVFYDSQDHYYETAGIVTLTGEGEWKTHTFTLENPRLRDIGHTYDTLMNMGISVKNEYMTSKGSVTIASAEIYYGEDRKLFFSLDSENVGNIFFGNEPVYLNLNLDNPNRMNHGDLTAKLTVKDKDDNDDNIEKTLPLGTLASLTQAVSLDELNLPFGLYTVTADIYDGEGQLVASDTAKLSRINSMDVNEPMGEYSVNNTFFGINTHSIYLNKTQSVKDIVYLAEKLGAGYIRINFGWNYFEPEAGEYEIIDKAKTFIEEAGSRNLKVMVMLGTKPSKAYSFNPWREVHNPDSDGYSESEQSFNSYLTAFADYVSFVADELKDDVECWEIGNEYTLGYPNYDKLDELTPEEKIELHANSAKDYADILKTGYNAIKAVDPTAHVVGGAIEHSGQYADHLTPLFEELNNEYMDALSYHFYLYNNGTHRKTFENKTNLVKGYIDQYPEGKNELYLSEFNYWYGGYGLQSMEDHTSYNTRFLIEERFEENIDRIYAYNLESNSYNIGRGLGYIDKPEDEYDYLATPFAARPNYAVMAFMNKLLRLSENIEFTEDADGNRIYEFYDTIHERPVYAIWNNDDISSTVTIEEAYTELSAYDMYGNKLSTENDSITVNTGKEPVYVTGPEKDFHMGDGDNTYKVTYNGNGTAGKNVSIVVLKKGLTEDDFNSVGQILYANQSVIDPGGEYSFTFKITQGNGKYEVLLAEENGESYVYELEYDAGELRVGYELSQQDRQIKTFASLGDGDLDISYRIDNPENIKSKYTLFACLYNGDSLVKVVKSEDSKFLQSDLITTGNISIPAVKKSDIDKVQIMMFDGTDNVRPLVKKFVLE